VLLGNAQQLCVMPNPTAAFYFASNSSQLPRKLEQAADAQDTEAAERSKHAVAGPTDVLLDEPIMNDFKQENIADDVPASEILIIMQYARVCRSVDDKLYRMIPDSYCPSMSGCWSPLLQSCTNWCGRQCVWPP